MLGALSLHSISYAGLWGQAFLRLEPFLDKAAELGYEGVMLMAKRPHLSALDYGAAERVRLRRHLDRRGLELACVAGYTNFTADLAHPDIPQLEMQVQFVTELARLTADLGGNLLRVFTGYESGEANYAAQWNLVVKGLRECARRAAGFGVTIGVQNHHDIGAGYESLDDLIRAVAEPNCRPLFDAWAPAAQGGDPAAAGARMGGLTPHTTVANYVRRPRYRYDPSIVNYEARTPLLQAVPLPSGTIDYAAFFAAMCGAGFCGSVAYEMCSPLIDGGEMAVLDRYAAQAVDYLRDLRAALGASDSQEVPEAAVAADRTGR